MLASISFTHKGRGASEAGPHHQGSEGLRPGRDRPIELPLERDAPWERLAQLRQVLM